MEREKTKNSGLKLIFFNVSWIMLGRITAKVVSLVFLPIITVYLDPEAYGLIALFFVEASFLYGFFELGLSSFASRMIYKYDRKDPEKCSQYIGVVLFYLACFGAIGVIIFYPFAQPLAKVFMTNTDRWPKYILYVPLVYAFFHNIYGCTSNNFISLQKNHLLFFCEFSEFILIFPVQVIGLVWFKFNWTHVVLLQLWAKIAVTILSLWLLRDHIRFSFKKLKIIKRAMRFSLPFALLNFVSSIGSQIDKVLLGNLTSVTNVGIYSMGNKFSEAFSFFSRPLMIAIKPEMNKRLDSRHQNIESDITDFFNIFFQLSLFFIFCITIFSKEIVHILVEAKYFGAFIVIPFLMFGYMFNEAGGLFQMKLFYKNKTMSFPFVTFLGLGISVLFNLLLIPQYKTAGAALAVFLTSFITFFLYYFLSQHASQSNYNLRKNLLSLGIVAIVLYMQSLLKFSSYFEILKVIAIFVYALVLFRHFERKNKRFKQIKDKIMDSIFKRFGK